MKHFRLFTFLLVLICLSVSVYAQKQQRDILVEKYRSFLDVHYGNYDRNAFDLYLPNSDNGKHPLVVYFHGGGFTQGDKARIKGELPIAQHLLDNGIAYASVNYRYLKNNDSLGVQQCIHDAVRFIQYIRYHASEYAIDSSRIACYGESAGAGISLYLAFHDNLADVSSKDPIAQALFPGIGWFLNSRKNL